MRRVVVQRVSALVVCTVGGAALYLSPTQLGDASTQVDQRTPSASASASSPLPPSPPPSVTDRRISVPPLSPSPSLHADRTLPTPVRNLHLSSNTAQTYTVGWRPSFDAAGIRHYVVLANGFLAGRTNVPSITLIWPNSNHRILVQVAPVDGNGLQGEWRALMIVPPPLELPGSTPPPSSTAPTQPPPSSRVPTRRPSSPPPPATSQSPSASTTLSPDPCTTEDHTPTATASDPGTPSTSPTASRSPSTAPTASSTPTTALSSEPGTPTGGPTDVPSC